MPLNVPFVPAGGLSTSDPTPPLSVNVAHAGRFAADRTTASPSASLAETGTVSVPPGRTCLLPIGERTGGWFVTTPVPLRLTASGLFTPEWWTLSVPAKGPSEVG